MGDLYSELYGVRLLVFIEKAPQSNQYYQVLLNKEEFKKVSLSIGRPTGKEIRPGVKEVENFTSEEEYVLPDLKEIYDM